MPRILDDASLRWRSGPSLPAWQGLSRALQQHGECLGLRSLDGLAEGPALHLLHPDLQPLHTHLAMPTALPLELTSEFTLQAACGLMSVHGRASGRAQALGVNYLASLNAALAWQATLAAAVGQLRGGRFHSVTLDPARGALLSIGQYLAGATAPEDAERLLPGQDDAFARPPFVSLEGTAFELETLDSQPWRHFWRALGISDSLAGKAWQHFLLRYARAVAAMPAECLDALAALPLAQIQAQAQASGVALVPLRSPAQRQADADYRASLSSPWRLTPGPQAQGYRAFACWSRAGASKARWPATCWRCSAPRSFAWSRRAGIRYAICRRAPTAARCASMRSITEVDIKSAAGRAEIDALCAEADVFLHNWAPGKAAELGLDAADLHARHPSLVHAYAGGWGDAAVQAPGTDFTVQAWSGVAERIARASGTRGGTLFTALDVLGGVISAQGVCAALLDRCLHARGSQVQSTLLGAADLLLASDSANPPSLLQGVFETGHGLLAVDCQNRAQRRALDQLLGAPCEAKDLPRRLASADAEHWQRHCQQAGIPASRVHQDLAALANDPRLADCFGQRTYRSVQSPWSFT